VSENRMFLRLSCVPSNVGVARIAVATFAASLDFTVPDIEELKVAVSEAVSNCVLHAYPDGQGDVTVEAYPEGDSLVILVEDRGVGIPDLDKAREPGYTTAPDHMGLGLSFMESFTDELSISSTKGAGTKVRMLKRRCAP
jgi:stage II sporulation protein AB (anti-sigma F factor)